MSTPSNESPGGVTDADIDALLAEMDKSKDAAAKPAAAPSAPAAAAKPAASNAPETVDNSDIEALLAGATFDDPGTAPVAAVEKASAAAQSIGVQTKTSFPAPEAFPLDLPDLQRAMADAHASSIDLLRDVDLNVKIELGRSKMLVEDVLKLAEGSVVELDKLAGDPVDVFVNDRLVARGEVLVLNDSFCVRVNEIVAGAAEVG